MAKRGRQLVTCTATPVAACRGGLEWTAVLGAKTCEGDNAGGRFCTNLWQHCEQKLAAAAAAAAEVSSQELSNQAICQS